MHGEFQVNCSFEFLLLLAVNIKSPEANPDAKRLYDDLLSNYNRLIRPVVNNTETITVWLGLKLSQLIEVNLKNQVMTTNVWVPQVRARDLMPIAQTTLYQMNSSEKLTIAEMPIV